MKLEINNNSNNEECPYRCNGGFILLPATGERVPCPVCNGVQRYTEILNQEVENNVYDKLNISPQYANKIGVGDEYLYLINKLEEANMPDALSLANAMEAIARSIDNKRVYRCSFYFVIDERWMLLNNFDWNMFVYCMQAKALSKGIGTMPFITINTLYLIFRSRERVTDIPGKPMLPENGVTGETASLMYRLFNYCSFDYFDYLETPLLFLQVTSAMQVMSIAVLIDLLTERSKRGLATYVIGYFDGNNYKDNEFDFSKYLYNNLGDSSRLDKLSNFEFKPYNKGREVRMPSSKRIFEAEFASNDTKRNSGIKRPAFTTDAIDGRDLI